MTNLSSGPSMEQDILNERTILGMKTDESVLVSIVNVVG